MERRDLSRNHLLAALDASDAKELASLFELVELPRGEALAQAGQRFDHAYFPLSGMISVVALLSEGLGAEVATLATRG